MTTVLEELLEPLKETAVETVTKFARQAYPRASGDIDAVSISSLNDFFAERQLFDFGGGCVP